ARGTVGILENRMRELDQSRLRAEQAVQTLREGLEEFRMALKELQVRRSDHAERLESMGFHLPTLISNMEDDDSVQGWEQELADVTRKIDRLGPINLAAIDEYKEQQQRKEYLDNQHADLTEAMETLESAIRKIDRETRTRFKETFDKVNSKLQEMFPRLFGGGHAYLELTGEDLL
ncbi:MAG: chromosome segregation protein SMC, partial [Pseudomonadales bacterium]